MDTPSFRHVMELVAVFGWLLQLRAAAIDRRRARDLANQPADAWPLKFPVHWADFYLGPAVHKTLRITAAAGSTAVVAIMAAAWLISREPGTTEFALWIGFLSFGFPAYFPRICMVSDRGLKFEKLYGWDHIHRFDLNDRRLLLVTERPTDRSLVEHVEIPLNGLPEHLRSGLAAKMSEHVTAAKQAEVTA